MKYEWLENAVFYEIYPTSFYDANGDGVGDIEGIIQKLPYLKELGINAVWMNPCFLSSFRDGGYDIADYYQVDPRFGTNEEMAQLFKKAGEMGIKICLDLVAGHTSMDHPWFQQSQKDEQNEFTDAYIWQPGTDPHASNGNYLCGLSERPAMFLINYFASQPALNYGYYRPDKPWHQKMTDPAPMKNRQRVIDICKFWLGLGAAGFRVDMASLMVKNDTKDRKGNIAFWNDVIPTIKEEYPEAVFISEWFCPRQSVVRSSFDIDFNGGYFLYTVGNRENDMVKSAKDSYFSEKGRHFKEGMIQFNSTHTGIKKRGYQSICQGNHDRERLSYGRNTDLEKIAFAFQLTMPHVPFIYYGDEVGMAYQKLKSKDGGYNRTGSRTPMQWDNSANRGFSASDTKALYLPVDSDPAACVSAQEGQPDSLLETVRSLVALKRKLGCFRVDSAYRVIKGGGNPFVFHRASSTDEAYVVVLPKKGEFAFRVKGLDDTFHEISNRLQREGDKIRSSGMAFGVFYKEK